MSKTRWHKQDRLIQKIIKPFGYYMTKGKTHNKIYSDEGKLLIACAGSPSCPHWYKNVVNDLIRRGLLPGVKKL